MKQMNRIVFEVLSTKAISPELFAFIIPYMKDKKYGVVQQYRTKREMKIHVRKVIEHRDDLAVALRDNGVVKGFFTTCCTPEDKYIELLCAFFKDSAYFSLAINYLKRLYPGFELFHYVFPANDRAIDCFASYNASFDPRQTTMCLDIMKAKRREIEHMISLVTPEFVDEYRAIHDENVYWVADKMLVFSDRMKARILLVEGYVAGYIDFSYDDEICEIYALHLKGNYFTEQALFDLISVCLDNLTDKCKKLFCDVSESEKVLTQVLLDSGFKPIHEAILIILLL